MTRFTSLLLALGVLLCPLAATAQDAANAQPGLDEEALSKLKNSDFKRELKALEEAAAVMEGVKDEETAKKAAQKIRTLFAQLPPPLKGSSLELDTWAKAQNKVSFYFWRLRKEPFFETAKLQEAWSLITDPYSRPSAQR